MTWYLALVLAFFDRAGGAFEDAPLTPWETLAGAWVYSFFSLLFTGWLSCSISAAICGTGLVLYARQRQSPPPETSWIEDLKPPRVPPA